MKLNSILIVDACDHIGLFSETKEQVPSPELAESSAPMELWSVLVSSGVHSRGVHSTHRVVMLVITFHVRHTTTTK